MREKNRLEADSTSALGAPRSSIPGSLRCLSTEKPEFAPRRWLACRATPLTDLSSPLRSTATDC